MGEARIWRSRPIFVTSTFRDMHAERDYLRTRVFPELEERLRERFHHLEPVDLRWGVEAPEEGEGHARELLVLKVCLGEIERSRPFLIALLGDRYGWQPPEDRMRAAAQEAGFDKDLGGKSITELEILFGILESEDQRRRSRFYFREALPYHEMPPDVAAMYSEEHHPDLSKAQRASAKLRELKSRIEEEMPDRVRHYRTKWDVEQNIVTGLDEWGRQVMEDLWADLEAETEEFLVKAPTTWKEQDRWALDEFIESRARGFVGRKQITEELMSLALSPAEEDGPWGVCVTGEAGTGKSSLFGHLYQELQKEDLLLLAHASGIGVGSTQVDRMLRRWVGELAAASNVDDPLDDDSSVDEIEDEFRRLLGQTSVNRRVVVLIDALNQFEPTTRAQHLTWIPRLWPPNARLISTTIPGTHSEALAQRPRTTEAPIPALETLEADQIIQDICRRYHRTVHPQVIRALLTKRRDDGTPAFGNPLWLELAVEELNLLDADDFSRIDTEFTGTGEERLRQLLLAVVDRMPAEVIELYGWMLDRAEELFGEAWASAFVNTIAVSRSGWRESDLRALMPELALEPWDDLKFAALRRSFRAHVVQRGAHAQWDLAHAQMRMAVERRYLKRDEIRVRIHSTIASHLLELPNNDPLHESETMVHLMGADDSQRAAAYYGGELTHAESEGATSAIASSVLTSPTRDQVESTQDGVTWATALMAAAPDDDCRHRICQQFNFNLDRHLENKSSLDTRWTLLRVSEQTMRLLVGANPTDRNWQRDLSVSHEKVGDVMLAQGDAAGALEEFRASLALAERLAEQDPTNADWQRDLSVSHDRVGDVMLAQGDAAGALEEFRASLALAERLAEQDPTNASWQRDLLVSHIKVGDVMRAQGDAAGALEEFRASLALADRLAEQDPTNAGWQRDLSVSHNKVGDVMLAQGDAAGALKAFLASLALAERLAEQDPTNASWQRNLSVSHDRVGDVMLAQGDAAGALKAFLASLTIRDRLAEQDPTNADWQRDLSVSHNKVGDVMRAQGDAAGALKAFLASLALAERLAEQDPTNASWQRNLSVSHDRVGDVMLAQGDAAGALKIYRASLTIKDRLAEQDPTNAGWQRDLSVSHEKVGDVMLAQGDAAGALEAFRESLTIRERLAEQDPTNASWQRDLSVSHNKVGNVMLAQGDAAGALEAFRESLALAERLAEQDPTNADWQRDLSVSHEKVGNVMLAQGDAAGALEAFRESLALAERLAEQDPTNADWQRDLSVSHNKVGNVMLAQGDAAGALEAFRESLALAERLAEQDPTNASWQRDLVVSLYKLATLHSQTEMADAATPYWRRCHDTLLNMARSQMHLDPPLVQLLQQLDSRFS